MEPGLRLCRKAAISKTHHLTARAKATRQWFHLFCVQSKRLFTCSSETEKNPSRSLVTQVGSQRTSMEDDCFKNAPILIMASPFLPSSVWCMHAISRNTSFRGRQSSRVMQKATSPNSKHHLCRAPRSPAETRPQATPALSDPAMLAGRQLWR